MPLIFSTALFSFPAFAEDFTINTFHADITISEDSSFTVKETLVVQFHQSKHGIYREIPFKYTDERGNSMKTPLRILSVTDSTGKDWKYRTQKKGNIVNIRIGDPEKYVEGIQTYIILYTVQNAILFFGDHDELYWNVTGNYWWAPIRAASVNVMLAVKPESQRLWAACYTGTFGSRESVCGYDASHNSATFFIKKNLSPREGLTIAFGWDKGLISPPSSWKKFLWAIDLEENWLFAFPFISLMSMISLWRSRGKDPKVRESVVVRYEPPKHNNIPLTPGEVGTLLDERLDSRDITSTIVGLATKGYIKIEETKTEGLLFDSRDYYLAKIKGADDALSPFEKILMNRIFSGELAGRMVSDMKNSFYTSLDIVKDTLYGELVSKKYFLSSPEKVRKIYVTVGIALIIVCSVLYSMLTSAPRNIIAGFLTGIPVLILAKAMPAKTRAGASAFMDVLGFQEFMNRAEKDQLERMGDKNLFSKFLPYAIALDVVDNWAKAFEGIIQEPPQWYTSHGGFRTFSPYHFTRSLNSATASMASAMYSAPRGSGTSSGGGGGGFSGGGFGGGGGGSW